jgi:hypothetical protein
MDPHQPKHEEATLPSEEMRRASEVAPLTSGSAGHSEGKHRIQERKSTGQRHHVYLLLTWMDLMLELVHLFNIKIIQIRGN